MTPSPPAPAARSRRQTLWICLLLAAVTLVLYWPVTRFQFVNYDDTDFITGNPVIQAGVTAGGLEYALRAEVARNWHPLTVLSHMLDCQLFGLRAGGHHLTSLLLHVANSVLLFLVLKRMTAALWRSAFVAALFAWHPLHVESVAWIAERKDVLSALFWWLTLWAWLGYAAGWKNPGSKSKLFYILAVFLYGLAAMSKPMVVTLPFVLLLLDYWPLRRFQFRAAPSPAGDVRAKPRRGPPAARGAAQPPLSRAPAAGKNPLLRHQRRLVLQDLPRAARRRRHDARNRSSHRLPRWQRLRGLRPLSRQNVLAREPFRPLHQEPAIGRPGRWQARSSCWRASPRGFWRRCGRGPGWRWAGFGTRACWCPSLV